MHLYKIVVASHEADVRDGLRRIIEQETNTLSLEGVYESGEELIEHLHNHAVDIVVAASSLPVWSGFAIARFIQEKWLDTRLILIADAAEAKCERDEESCHVDRILEKPVSVRFLLETINQIIAEIDAAIQSIYARTQQELLVREIKRRDLHLFISGVLPAETFLRDSQHLFGTLPLSKKICALVTVSTREGAENPGVNWHAAWQDMAEIEDARLDVYLIMEYRDSITLLAFAQTNQKQLARLWINAYIEHLMVGMRKSYGIECEYRCNIYGSILDIHQTNRFEEIIQLYNTYLLMNDTFARRGLLMAISLGFDLHNLKEYINQMIVNLQDKVKIDRKHYIGRLESLTHKEAVIDLMYQLDKYAQEGLAQENTLINKIINYINANPHDVALKTVAGVVFINSSYLSRLFKKETGEKFIDYTMKVRLERAKVLLKTSKYTIHTIATMLGFSSAKYFSNNFKKKLGITPSQYKREQVDLGEANNG